MRITAALCGVILALVVGGASLSSVVYGTEYTFRAIRHLGADVNDYKIFPERPLAPSSQPLVLVRQSDGDRVRRQFEAIFGVGDFDAFLRDTRTQAFIVIQDDTILYEGYFNGASRDSIVTSFSIAKSFTSALVGIAIAEGAIASVEDPITHYLPELSDRDPGFPDITIRHLLMMSSGIRYVERNFLHGDDALTYYHPDLRRLALERTHIIGPPGERFLYNNYHPLLLGMILERATGQPVTNYLQAKIWDPIGTEFGGHGQPGPVHLRIAASKPGHRSARRAVWRPLADLGGRLLPLRERRWGMKTHVRHQRERSLQQAKWRRRRSRAVELHARDAIFFRKEPNSGRGKTRCTGSRQIACGAYRRLLQQPRGS